MEHLMWEGEEEREKEREKNMLQYSREQLWQLLAEFSPKAVHSLL